MFNDFACFQNLVFQVFQDCGNVLQLLFNIITLTVYRKLSDQREREAEGMYQRVFQTLLKATSGYNVNLCSKYMLSFTGLKRLNSQDSRSTLGLLGRIESKSTLKIVSSCFGVMILPFIRMQAAVITDPTCIFSRWAPTDSEQCYLEQISGRLEEFWLWKDI